MTDKRVWHAIIVDDRQAEEIKELIEGNGIVNEPDRIEVTVFEDFDKAILELSKYRFDLVVLDLKDDNPDLAGEEAFKGTKVFEAIKATQFAPVVFYTAHPTRAEIKETPFLKIVTRGDTDILAATILSFLATKLPHISRHIEDQKINYMWSFLEEHWSDFFSGNNALSCELAYLLARRLANTLQQSSIRRFVKTIGAQNLDENDASRIHPIEMYLIPPIHPSLLGGDILCSKDGEYCVVVSPSCDLEHENADFVLMAKCEEVREQKEFKKFRGCLERGVQISKTAKSDLKKLISDNRASQRDRYVCLPGVLNLPYLVVDFQQICRVKFSSKIVDSRVASLDSPFAEGLLSKFTRYFSRIGTPDVDQEIMFEQLEKIERDFLKSDAANQNL